MPKKGTVKKNVSKKVKYGGGENEYSLSTIDSFYDVLNDVLNILNNNINKSFMRRSIDFFKKKSSDDKELITIILKKNPKDNRYFVPVLTIKYKEKGSLILIENNVTKTMKIMSEFEYRQRRHNPQIADTDNSNDTFQFYDIKELIEQLKKYEYPSKYFYRFEISYINKEHFGDEKIEKLMNELKIKFPQHNWTNNKESTSEEDEKKQEDRKREEKKRREEEEKIRKKKIEEEKIKKKKIEEEKIEREKKIQELIKYLHANIDVVHKHHFNSLVSNYFSIMNKIIDKLKKCDEQTSEAQKVDSVKSAAGEADLLIEARKEAALLDVPQSLIEENELYKTNSQLYYLYNHSTPQSIADWREKRAQEIFAQKKNKKMLNTDDEDLLLIEARKEAALLEMPQYVQKEIQLVQTEKGRALFEYNSPGKPLPTEEAWREQEARKIVNRKLRLMKDAAKTPEQRAKESRATEARISWGKKLNKLKKKMDHDLLSAKTNEGEGGDDGLSIEDLFKDTIYAKNRGSNINELIRDINIEINNNQTTYNDDEIIALMKLKNFLENEVVQSMYDERNDNKMISREIINDLPKIWQPKEWDGGRTNKKRPKKEILGEIRCIYKKPGDRKEYVKHKGKLITVKDYKALIKQKAKPKKKST